MSFRVLQISLFLSEWHLNSYQVPFRMNYEDLVEKRLYVSLMSLSPLTRLQTPSKHRTALHRWKARFQPTI